MARSFRVTPQQDYAALRAWVQHLGGFKYYADVQVKRARATDAPADAIYEIVEPGGIRTGEWRRVADLDDQHRFRDVLASKGVAA